MNHQLEYNMKGGTVILTQVEGQVLFPVEGGGFEAAPCMWFALCENPAVTTEFTPATCDTPICERCHRRMFPEKYEKKEK